MRPLRQQLQQRRVTKKKEPLSRAITVNTTAGRGQASRIGPEQSREAQQWTSPSVRACAGCLTCLPASLLPTRMNALRCVRGYFASSVRAGVFDLLGAVRVTFSVFGVEGCFGGSFWTIITWLAVVYTVFIFYFESLTGGNIQCFYVI